MKNFSPNNKIYGLVKILTVTITIVSTVGFSPMSVIFSASAPSASFIPVAQANNTTMCQPGETQTDFEYLSKPQITTIDGGTTDYAYKLCSDIYNGVSVDTSNGQPHYIYLTWDNFNPSEYDGFLNFDLKLYHMENQSTLKVELKNQFGIWVEVCDPAERTSYTWDNCDLAPFEHILKEVSKVELRIVGLRDGACYQYLKCAKLDLEVYKCESPEPYCGDGNIDEGEECDDGNIVNGDGCSATCQIEEEETGSIRVCKIIIDSEGNIVDGSESAGDQFSISGISPSPAPSTGGAVGQIGISTFTTPLNLNASLFGDSEHEARCVTYSDLPFGNYYYAEETFPADGWESPLYNDQYGVQVNSISDFYEYSGQLFDSNSGNDEARNTNADGHIVLAPSRPDRTLVVLNQYEAQPYCGDGNLDEGEECEIGHECGEGYVCDVEKCVCEQKPEEPLGSITVCKIIADSEGNIIDGFEFFGTNFSISGFTPEPLPSTGAPIGELPNSIFIAPLSLSDDIIGNDGINDADCITYTDLEFGGYYYKQELLLADGWKKPLYNDQFTVEVEDLGDLYEYDNKLFDDDPSNDGDRNENVDGHIVISKSRPDRTLIVFNQREKIIVEPFCGDGNIDDGEECDDGNNNDGDGCSANCTIELPVCDINIELVENGGFESPLIADSQSWGIFTDSVLGGWHVEWMSLSPSEFGGYSRPTNAYLELQNDLTGWAPQEGNQYAELDSDWDGYGGSLNGEPASVKIYQDIQTIPGETYTVSFWFSPRPNTALENNRLGFNWNGDVVANDIEGAGENTTTWTKHTYEFVATSNSARIQFSDLGVPSDSTGTFIDNVSVRCGTYEPEPYCGDGNLDEGEECDGDVGVPENYICTSQCTLEYVPYCGDGIINQTSEECDGEDGVGENQACTSQCILIDIPWCGDGVKNGEEECDGTDGVGTNQSCSEACTLINLPYCGDGNIDSGEQCDNGAQNGQICTPGCGSTCSYCSAVCTIITLTGGTCGGGGGGGGGGSYPALAITKFIIEDVANPGQTLHYTIKLKNNGNAPATSVKLTDTLPNGFTFSDTGLAYKEWDLGDITMGVEKITSYEVIVGANVLAGEYKNVASAKATNQGVIYANAMIVILGEVLGERIELPNTGIDSFWLIFAGLSLIWLSLIGTYLILFSSRCKIQTEN